MLVAGLLHDLAVVHARTQRERACKNAAFAVIRLDQSLEMLTERGGGIRKIADVGPSSTRIIAEVMKTGESGTVAAAVDASGRRDAVIESRSWRSNFFSRARVVAILADDSLPGPVREDYRGDLQMHDMERRHADVA